MFANNRGESGGGGSTRNSGAPQKVAPRTTISARQRVAPHTTFFAKPASSPAPRRSAPQRSYSPPVRHSSPAPAPYHPPRTTSSGSYRSGGGGGGNGGGGGGRPNNPPQAKQGKIGGAGKAKGAGIPDINKYLSSDATYNQSLSELMRTLNQYKTNNQSSQGDVKEAFKTAMERMGEERTKSLQGLQDDFASRGLLTSGLYADATSQYNNEYEQRVGDLTKDQQNQLESLNTDYTNFAGTTNAKKGDLRLDAIRRRAEKYGIKQ